MNMNRLHSHWPISCSDSLTALDRMSLSDALAIGLITIEESEAILEAFDNSMAVALEAKGYATAADIHPVPNSEIVRRFRKGAGQQKANRGSAEFFIP